MPYTIPREWDFAPVYTKLSGVFDADACRQIVAMHAGRDPMVSEMEVDDVSIRSTDLYWLLPEHDGTDWVYERLRAVVHDYNDRTYRFEIDG